LTDYLGCPKQELAPANPQKITTTVRLFIFMKRSPLIYYARNHLKAIIGKCKLLDALPDGRGSATEPRA